MEIFNFLLLIWDPTIKFSSKSLFGGVDLVLCSAPKFGPHPEGSYEGQGGLLFYVGTKCR